MSAVTITNTRPEHIASLVIHQELCFPTVGLQDLLREQHFQSHLLLFPEGQHVALDGDRVVGQSSTFRCTGATAFAPHRFNEIIAGGMFTGHDSAGEWLYGADMSVHPEYRGRGIATLLYNARKELVRQLGLRGMVAGGMLPGYANHRDSMSVDEYIEQVARGELRDATLTAQLRNGFVVRGVLRDYIDGGAMGSDSVLIVWEAE